MKLCRMTRLNKGTIKPLTMLMNQQQGTVRKCLDATKYGMGRYHPSSDDPWARLRHAVGGARAVSVVRVCLGAGR